jgi:hypothetical protein
VGFFISLGSQSEVQLGGISIICDEDLWDETLMIRRPCHQLLKAKNNRVVGG